jgi:hypothetical protein
MQGVSKRRLQTKACIAGAKTFLMLFNMIFWVRFELNFNPTKSLTEWLLMYLFR